MMEPKITDEELKLLNALYWWQMTGNWPRRIKDKSGTFLKVPIPLPAPLTI
jgi:hypothetical protein